MNSFDSFTTARITSWLNGSYDQSTKEEILHLLRFNPSALKQAFSSCLSFGTGGMRGLMGVGTSRINQYTIQIATQGLANYLHKEISSKEGSLSVFIGYDSRHGSQDFALEAARVLAGNGIQAYLTSRLCPTPFVSFGLRAKRCHAGIMITASHNPKEYNGYKVYWKDGAQVVAPHDFRIAEEINKISGLEKVKTAPSNSPFIEILSLELELHYLEEIHKLCLRPKENKKVGDQLKITYTPLHGVGITLIPRALKEWGFSNVNPVDAQMIPDGNFPTVKSPNPENKETLSLAIEQMMHTESDIVIATDPDADRMAVAVRHHNQAHILNGNQIGAICLEYICQTLKKQKRLPKEAAVVTTIVSSDLIKKITEYYQLHYFEVLTGFKYIGELIHLWEEKKAPFQFLFGVEESYGYLMGTHSRDKDAIIASCLIAEVALLMKLEGHTLVDFLQQIYEKYGVFLEGQKTLDFELGASGMKKMHTIMEELRLHPDKNSWSQELEVLEDYQTKKRIEMKGKKSSSLLLPQSDVLLFRLKDLTKIIIRPSGTEPKLKIYVCVQEHSSAPLKERINNASEKLKRLLNSLCLS